MAEPNEDKALTKPIRVLIADDEPLIRAGVRSIVTTDPMIDVIAEAADGREAVELVRQHRPHVVLMDIRMPNMDGLTAAREIRATAPMTKIIILTTFSDDDYITEAFEGGATGFLLKASDPRELINATHAVAAGAAYLSPRIAHHVIGLLGANETTRKADALRRVERLTERELDVLTLLAAGHSNADIGRRLHLVEGTVKGHVSAILIKTDARNRVQAAVLAYEAGLG